MKEPLLTKECLSTYQKSFEEVGYIDGDRQRKGENLVLTIIIMIVTIAVVFWAVMIATTFVPLLTGNKSILGNTSIIIIIIILIIISILTHLRSFEFTGDLLDKAARGAAQTLNFMKAEPLLQVAEIKACLKGPPRSIKLFMSSFRAPVLTDNAHFNS